jgi:organic radical activating enzyme
MDRYSIAEMIGPTLHDVGAHAGRACVLLRFGRGHDMTAAEIVRKLVELDTSRTTKVVVTGDDAARVWDSALSIAVRGAGFRVLLETDGSRAVTAPIDWLSIKPGANVVDGLHADEVQIAVDDSTDELALDLSAARWRCDHYFVVVRDDRHVARAVALIMARPRWRLSRPIAMSAASLRAPQQDVKSSPEPKSTPTARFDQPLRTFH